jgi:hypothetical protein
MRVQTCGVVVLNPSELINWKNSSGSQWGLSDEGSNLWWPS